MPLSVITIVDKFLWLHCIPNSSTQETETEKSIRILSMCWIQE